MYPVACSHPISFKYNMVGSGNILEPLDNMWHSQGCDIITRGGLLTYLHYDVLGVVTIFTPRVIVYIISLMCFACRLKMITILILYEYNILCSKLYCTCT